LHRLHDLKDIAGFLLETATAPLFHARFADVPLGLDCWS